MRRAGRWLSEHAAMIAALAVLGYLFLPVAYTFVFSFNDYRRSNITWNSASGPTLEHWRDPCGAPGVCEALVTSLQVGAIATAVSTVLGTLVAFALVRYRFRGRGLAELLVLLPMATPEVVLGASLLTIFVQGLTGVRLGLATVVAAHVMFCLAFVVITVRARLLTLDPRLEEAALDLYAGPGQAFARVTLPLAAPGIVAGALLAFSLSFDDVVVTGFVSGETMTFPRYVYVSYLRGVPAQVNVIGFSMFVLAVALVLLARVVGRAHRR